MGVSFKLSSTGKRYRHKPPPLLPTAADEDHNDKAIITTTTPHSVGERNDTKSSVEEDSSFTVSLFPDGYSVGKPLPLENEEQSVVVNVPKLMHPYDRASESLFSAIECGQFPGDILDDIPCKFVDGRAFCEVRDYRTGSLVSNKVCLRICLENIVHDIPSIAENDWTYGDLMEVESRILKAIQPQLCLDPAPQLDGISKNTVPTKLNFEIRSMRRKRLLQMSQASDKSKRVCLDGMNTFSNNDPTSVHGKRHDQDWQSSQLTNKKTRVMPTGSSDGNLPHLGSHIENLHGADPWKNTLMQQQSQMARIHQINQEGGTVPFTMGQQGIRYNMKEEPMETVTTNIEQRMPQQFMRSSFSQSPRNNFTQPLDNNSRKDDTYQKRKVAQSPVMSVGLPQSFTTSANDNMQQQHQGQAAPRRKSTSLPKNPGISGVGSPSSVGTGSTPINASSPHIGNRLLADQSLLDRFSKIELVTMRHQPNREKKKPDENINLRSFSTELLAHELSDSNRESFPDETCKMLSKSSVGGDVNACKIRILEFYQKEQVNGVQHVTKARTRMILSEKPNDGVVAMHIGDIDHAEYLATVDYLPTLPNTHMADLLAAQFCSLMADDGYDVKDYLEPYQAQMNHAPPIAQQARVFPSTAEFQQSSEGLVSGRQPSSDNKPSTSGNIVPINSSPDVHQNQQGPRMNAQTSQISKGQQNSLIQPQQQFQRSQMMFSNANSMQHPNNILQNSNNVAHMETKPSSLQLQQLLQQQPPQMQRKIIAGLGNVGMGNIGNNMAGMGNFGNVMGLGGARGVSAPMGNMGNNMNLSTASNISNAIRAGMLTPEQLNHLKMRMAAQGRPSMMLGGSPQMGAPRQMTPRPTGLPMFGSALNHRGDMNQMQLNQMQRTSVMGGMGPPKLMSGMNAYMNQQQQMQQLQQMQQETASPLQQAVMSPQMGSPSMSQQASPQQMSQRTPMSPQLSGGAMHQMMNGGNTEAVAAGPSSPQVSGSVGSINNSSMELQGANKNNSQ